MAISKLPGETPSKIRFSTSARMKSARSPYDFKISADGRYIYISNGKTRRPYSIEVLRKMIDGIGFNEASRDMARQALEYFDKLPKEKEKEVVSEPVTIIEGVKVYMDIKGRKFFAIVRGKPFYRVSLTDLEKIIKNGGRE